MKQNVLDNVTFMPVAVTTPTALPYGVRNRLLGANTSLPHSTAHRTNRFFNFRQGSDVKHSLFNEIQRPEVDYFQFSEHGAPDTQYITNLEQGTSLKSDLDMLERSLRSHYEHYKGTPDEEEFLKEVDSEFGLSREMFSDELMAEQDVKDSLANAESNIGLGEIVKLKSAPRVVVFNACYNGSFHDKEGYVAVCHVFNAGAQWLRRAIPSMYCKTNTKTNCWVCSRLVFACACGKKRLHTSKATL